MSLLIIVLASCAGRGDVGRRARPAPVVARASAAAPVLSPSPVVPAPSPSGRGDGGHDACDADAAEALTPELSAGAGCRPRAGSTSSLMTELQ